MNGCSTTLLPSFLHKSTRTISSTTDSSQAMNEVPVLTPYAGVRRASCLHGYISKTRILIFGSCLQAVVKSQGEEEAEGSCHSISRKLGLYTLESLNERAPAAGRLRVKFLEEFKLSSYKIQAPPWLRWHRGKEPTCQCRRHWRPWLDPWVRKILWRRKWQPTPVFLPGKSHGQRSLVGYSPWGCKRVRYH